MIRQTLRLSAGSATQVQSNRKRCWDMTPALVQTVGLLIHSTRLSAKLKLHLNDVEWTLFMNGIAILI